MIRTNIYKSIGINDPEQYFEARKNDGLVGRVGTVDDISAGIVYLASESFVTGTSLVVDGGWNCVGLGIDLN